ncbi:hypothetical protein Trydic_g13180 [Trypoxylus dichotomus]
MRRMRRAPPRPPPVVGVFLCGSSSISEHYSLKTEFISSVQGQCAPSSLPTPSTATSATFGGEPPGVLASTPIVVATSSNTMNQLGTVYATKRRRRNGKRNEWYGVFKTFNHSSTPVALFPYEGYLKFE